MIPSRTEKERKKQKFKQRNIKTSSEERQYQDQFSTNMQAIFYRKNASQLNELDKPVIYEDEMKETPKMGESSPLRNEAISKAFITEEMESQKKKNKVKGDLSDFSFGYKNENKATSMSGYNSKLMKYIFANKKKIAK